MEKMWKKHLTEFNISSWFEKKKKTLCKLEIGKRHYQNLWLALNLTKKC